jgi:hypothetical protein
LALASGSVSISLYRPDSEDSIEDDSSLFGAAKRKNVDEPVFDPEPIVKKKKIAPVSSGEPSFELHWTKEEPLRKAETSAAHHDPPIDASSTSAQDGEPQLLPQQQQQLFMTGDPTLEHEVCSPQPANCSTPTFSKPASADEDDVEPLPPPSDAIVSWLETFSRWNHADKMVALDQLIGICHPTQVRHMMTVIEPQFQRDFISLLPKEVRRPTKRI